MLPIEETGGIMRSVRAAVCAVLGAAALLVALATPAMAQPTARPTVAGWATGDYLKFLHATSYTEAVLLTGVRDFPAQMGASSAASDFRAEARFGARWLLRMWDDKTRTLYYQVGIGSGNAKTAGDHDLWRLPQRDDTWRPGDPLFRYIRHRPVFRAGPPGQIGADA